MKLSNIRDILAVAEAGGLRAASRKLGITQPTMTRSIRDAENELGIVLFKRNANGVVPTDLGRIFIRRAIAVETELRKINEELAQAQGKFTGQVSVAMSTAASIALIPTVLKKFQKKYPDAVLKLTESLFHGIEADVQSGQVDFFVGPFAAETTTTSLRVETLFEYRRSVIARKGHPLAGATSMKELRDVRWIRPSFSDRRDETDFETMFEQANLPPPDVVVHARSATMTLLAVANSDMFTVLPLQWLELSPSKQNICVIPLRETLYAAPVCIIRRADLPLTPLAEAFYDMVQKAGHNYQLQMEARRKSQLKDFDELLSSNTG